MEESRVSEALDCDVMKLTVLQVRPWANSEMITHEDVTKAAERWKLKS